MAHKAFNFDQNACTGSDRDYCVCVMSTHFTITIKVAYDKATIPDDMINHLRDNVQRCVERAQLLNDSNLEAVVDTFSVEVEKKEE